MYPHKYISFEFKLNIINNIFMLYHIFSLETDFFHQEFTFLYRITVRKCTGVVLYYLFNLNT